MKKNIGKASILNELLTYLNFKKNKDLANFLGITAVKIGNWYARDYSDIYLIKEKLPEIDANWLLNPIGPVKLIRKAPDAGIPLLPLDSISGYDKSKILEKNYEMIYVPEFDELGVEFAITIKGDSMSPHIKGGDKVGCIKVNSNTVTQWNRVYVLDTNEGVIVRRVQKGANEGGVLCVSDNDKYDSFTISLKEIKNISLVVACISFE